MARDACKRPTEEARALGSPCISLHSRPCALQNRQSHRTPLEPPQTLFGFCRETGCPSESASQLQRTRVGPAVGTRAWQFRPPHKASRAPETVRRANLVLNPCPVPRPTSHVSVFSTLSLPPPLFPSLVPNRILSIPQVTGSSSSNDTRVFSFG
jgi:hypothetical protein